ncbi:MAG: gliding motility-associated C-terminal domain-containing protein [Flavobacteriales bacterium]
MRIVAFLLLLLPYCVIAQPQHSKWFFGFGAGLDMSTTPPSAMPGPLSTDEGCASIADDTGQLLFFTNGENVWDRNMDVMPNGTGLLGHFSTSQSAVIVPFPDDPTKYYVFTAPAAAGFWSPTGKGHYSVVDMLLNNGLGAVTVKNVELVGPVTEKLTATRHANGVDVWVLYHSWGSADYHAYLVTCTGVEGPITTTIGSVMGDPVAVDGGGSGGCMKMNPQGTKLAATWTNTVLDQQGEYTFSAHTEVLEFDHATGLLSNVQGDSIGGVGGELWFGYGVEFSANGLVLFTSNYGLVNGISSSTVVQYDLNAPDPMSTRSEVGSGSLAHGSMQRAPDGMLYIARLNGAQFLSAITAPNMVGSACGYVDNAVSISPSVSTWGLPNQWDTYPEPVVWDPTPWQDSLLCGTTQAVIIDATYMHPFHTATYSWNTGEITATITVTEPGTYTVTVSLPCSVVIDSVLIHDGGIPVELGSDISVCDDQIVILAVDTTASSYAWNTGSDAAHIVVESSGNYSVTVTDSLGCITEDEVYVEQRDCLCPMYLPNAFSPNQDGINDLFHAAHNCTLLNFSLALYDRWGEQIFFSDAPEIAWDGTVNGAQPVLGIYTWALHYSWDDGEGIRSVIQHGHVTALR